MNASTHAPKGATQRPPRQTATSKAEQPTWREQIRDLLPEVVARLENAGEVGDLDSSTNGWAARALLFIARDMLARADALLASGDAGDYLREVYDVQAMVRGAIHLPDTAVGLADVLRPADALLERVTEIADVASVQRKAPPLAVETDDTAPPPASETEFMAGIELLAKMQEIADRISDTGSDEADLHAKYRPRGTQQNNYALPLMRELMANPALLVGFSAGLSDLLVHGETADELRALTFEDYVAGPHTDYSEIEEPPSSHPTEPVSAASVASEDGDIPPKPRFRNDAEKCLDQAIDRLEGWLWSTEHTDGGTPDNAFELMHQLAWGPFYDAQRALYTLAGAEATKAHLRKLREGLEAVDEELGPCDGRYPAVRMSLDLLEHVLETQDSGELSARMETARQASTFIARLCDYYLTATHQGTIGDLMALEKAASVILSAIDDHVITDDELRADLDAALELASVVLKEQLPRSLEAFENSAAFPKSALHQVVH